MRRSPRRAVPLLAAALLLVAAPATAWPVSLMESLRRDARRLLPASLARLMAERERQIRDETEALPDDLARALATDRANGSLQPATIAALDARTAAVVKLLREGRLSDGVIAMGGLVRIPADLSDPVLTVGAAGYPSGVTAEYYRFMEKSLDKIPVVLDNPRALTLTRKRLPGYWQSLLTRSRSDSPVIRTEMFVSGRVISHRSIDYRNPVFGVASLSYSRAVTAIAATWLAVWREAQGDVTGMRAPREVEPRNPGTMQSATTVHP